ncbi:hypothetical protein PVIIG_05877 [Plasmodium vivax India VII]|uniref:PIR Superfamily Protein n=1 Tax=Plasmodium vivax India VII TaxID=1077284 RepID=A0A0J9S2L6_PLAVI|nr:hypothetical protein PVIIG_05877 [Plasmodium vivax India VII]
MEAYIEKIEKITDQTQYDEDLSCESVEKKDIPPRILENHICEKFNKLYTLLCGEETKVSKEDAYSFLNFWLNNSLYSIGELDQIDIKSYFQKLKSNVNGLNEDIELDNNLSNINSDLLENMNILYNLHTNLKKIRNGSNEVCKDRKSCLNFYNICVEEYKKGIIKCSNNGNNFCNEVYNFNTLYNTFKQILLSSGKLKSSDLFDLPTYDEVAKEFSIKYAKKMTIMICSIFGPVFGIITLWICIKKVKTFINNN